MKEFEGKKLLVLGGFVLACDIVRRAQELGAYVYVADYNPDVLGSKVADQFVLISATDVDAIVDFCKKEKIDGVTTGFVDILLEPCYQVCQKLGIPCYMTPKMISMSTNKIDFKKTCNQYGVPVPQTYLVGGKITDDIYAKIQYPVFVKPLDASGSRGAAVCEDRVKLDKQFVEAVEYSPSGNAIIEDYIVGREFLLDYVGVNGEFRLLSMFDRYACADRGSALNYSNIAISPSRFLAFYMNEINPMVVKMFGEVGFKDGLMFMQGFAEKGKITFYEMGCRLGGSYYNHQRAIIGDDAVSMIIRYALTGRMVKDISILPENVSSYNGKFAACINYLLRGPRGVVSSFVGEDTVKNNPACITTIKYHEVGFTYQKDKTIDKPIFTIEMVSNSESEGYKDILSFNDAFDVLDSNGQSVLMDKFDPKDF